MTAYYNEIDPAAVAILHQLIADDVIAPGDVDTRSIKDVQADDLRGYAQCHFFAGGGLWSVAARMAGWPDLRSLWTGSCPCQPFSAAGKGAGIDDPRHLWPDFHRLIGAAGRAGFGPSVLVGEQVAGEAGYDWFYGVRADLADEGIKARTVDIPSCAVDAPHQRNRLYWIAVADAIGSERDGRPVQPERRPEGRNAAFGSDERSGQGELVNAASIGWGEGRPEPELRSGRPAAPGADASGVTLGDAFRSGLEGHTGHGDELGRAEQDRPVAEADGANAAGDVANGSREPSSAWDAGAVQGLSEHERPSFQSQRRDGSGRNGSAWADADWIICHDGKARHAKSGLRLLVDGLPGRVDLWRVGGNAIVPVEAAEVLSSLLDVERMAA